MPHLHPDPPRILPDRHGERAVLAALRSLGPDVHVFHGLTILDGAENRQREIDFLLVHPEWGLLLLEVKGGKVGWEGDRWWLERDGQRRDLEERPAEQMAQQRYRLEAYLRSAGAFVPPITQVLILPHTRVVPGTRFGPDLPAERVIDRDGLCRLLPSLKAALAGGRDWATYLASKEAQERRLFGPTLDRLLEALQPSVLPPPSLAEVLAAEGRLQDAQAGVLLEHLAGNFARGRYRVQGGPGSGKSLLGRLAARAWAAEGRRVLAVCFNKALKVATLLALEDLGEQVDCFTFHEFLDVQLEAAGCPCKPGADGLGPWFEQRLPEAFAEALPHLRPRWDALVVDEAQDLRPDWVDLLARVLRDPDRDPVLLLEDPAQALYRQVRHHLGAPWRLDLNLRQHPALRKAVWEALPDCGWPDPGGEVDPEVVARRRSAPGTWRRDLEGELARLAGEGLRPLDLLVLLPHTPARYGLRTDQRLGPWRIGVDRDWIEDQDQERLRVNTVHAFKGLEAEVVIYLTSADGDRDAQRLRYTALSRARRRAVVLEKALPPVEREPVPQEPAPPPPPPFDPRRAAAPHRAAILGVLKAVAER